MLADQDPHALGQSHPVEQDGSALHDGLQILKQQQSSLFGEDFDVVSHDSREEVDFICAQGVLAGLVLLQIQDQQVQQGVQQ